MGNESFDPRNESDSDLIEYMKWRKEHPDVAMAAFGEFYDRHVRYLFVVCWNAFGEDIGDAGVEDLVQETFWRAFEKIDSFIIDGSSGDGARRRVRAWLGRIAQRLYLTNVRSDEKRIKLVTGEDERISGCEARHTPLRELTRDEELINRGMKEILNDKERLVLESYVTHYDPESDYPRSPKGVVGQLCTTLGITDENIRAIRSRALRKLEKFVIAGNSTAQNEKEESYVPKRGQQPKTTRRR